jgi:hypothetical protein
MRVSEFSENKWSNGLVIITFGLVLISSCTKKDDFTIGNFFVEGETKLAIVDTFTVQMSTVMVDSITTSGTGVILTGSYCDGVFGSVSATSYFEPGYASMSLDNTCIFDSASVTLLYSGYSYGDTTALSTISIYQLDEEIESNDNNYLYNHSDFAYSDKLIGTKAFYPEPASTDTLFININSFGQQLFTLFQNDDPDIGSSEQLVKYLKGFAITVTGGNSIIGFKADAAEVFIRFYYHVSGSSTFTASVSLPFGLTGKQLNTVRSDFSGTSLETIRPDYIALQSQETGNAAYMQSMVALFPKITFPTLQDITLENKWRVLKAELVFQPVVGSYNKFALPGQLCLYRTDHNNKVGKVLSGSDGSVIYSKLVTDEMYNEYTGYTIDISSYLNTELADNYFDGEQGLLMNVTTSDLNKSFSRLLIECKDRAVKLRLYYLSY